MRSVLILIVLAALGYAGWSWYSGRKAAAALAAAAVVPVVVAPPVAPPPPPTPIPAEVKGDLEQAEALWKQAESTGPNPAASPKAPLMGKLYSKVLRGLYNQPGLAAIQETLIKDRLTPIGTELFFRKTTFPNDESGLIGSHQVKAGESPERIARRYGMSMESLNRLRGRDANDSKLNADDVVKIIKVKDHGGYLVHVDKSDYLMDVFIGGIFAKRYEISHGAPESPTPVGKTHLVSRERNPSWTNPKTHEVYNSEDPRNILGKVWMKFDPASIGEEGLGIHGYTGPDAKWKAQVSNGCIRMQPTDAMEVFQLLASPDRAKTNVEIVE